MKRTIAASAALALALLTGCQAEDGTDFAGNSISDAEPTAAAESPAAEVEPTQQAEGPKEFDMGYEATVTQEGKDALKIALSNARVVKPDASNYDSEPTKGQYIAVDVKFTALVGPQDVNPFDFVALSGTNRIEPGIPCCGIGEGLNYAALNSGESLSGSIVFDVPPGTVTGIAYAPLSQVLGTWKVAL